MACSGGGMKKYLLFILFFLYCQVASAIPAHVQTPALVANTASSTVTRTITWTQGDLGVVGVLTFTVAGTRTISSVVDDVGNTFLLAVVNTNNFDRTVAIYYCPNVVGGAATVTATFSGVADNNILTVSEYSGVQTASPNELATNVNGGLDTTPSVTLNPSAPNSLYYGLTHTLGVDTTITETFTSRAERETFPTFAIEDTVGSGSKALSWTLGVASFWDALGVTFKPKAGGLFEVIA